MFQWLKELFNKFFRMFRAFITIVFTSATKILIAQLKDIAIQAVNELETTDMTNEQKRKEAFNRIKDYALNKQIVIRDSLINLVIEMALQYIRNSVN